MRIGFSIKELSHLTIPTAIAAIELEMIIFLDEERGTIQMILIYSPPTLLNNKIILDSFSTPCMSSLRKKRGRYESTQECDEIRCDTEIPEVLPQLLFSETVLSSSITPYADFSGIGKEALLDSGSLARDFMAKRVVSQLKLEHHIVTNNLEQYVVV